MFCRARAPLLCFVFFALLAMGAEPARANMLRWTLSASFGMGVEVHPAHQVQAENLMLSLGLGILRDMIRFEAGAVSAYGALASGRSRQVHIELRPMVRFALPLVPLYARLIFSGLHPFAKDRNIAYGGALGLNIPLGLVSLFGEAGTLPRHVDGREHWIVEARLGLGCSI